MLTYDTIERGCNLIVTESEGIRTYTIKGTRYNREQLYKDLYKMYGEYYIDRRDSYTQTVLTIRIPDVVNSNS